MRTVTTCGKLYLAGEYAVLTAGQPALIKSVPFYMTATIEASDQFVIFSDLFDYRVDLTPDANYALIQETVTLFADYLGQELMPFALTISGKLERDGKKLGLGSSGSVVLLVLRAMAELYGLSLSADQLFRLAVCVLIKRGDNGSMGDLACIAYEDLVYYRAFDRQQVSDWLMSRPLAEVLGMDWGYVICPVKPALGFEFLVGWTGQPAISSHFIRQVKSTITADFLAASQMSVDQLRRGLELGDRDLVLSSLTKSGQLVADLHPAILTDQLASLVSASDGLTITAKSSGAGGGDCGIAISFDPEQTKILVDRWEQAGITLLHKETIDE